MVQKKFIEPTELFETGVYNSEIDVNANPKTDANTADQSTEMINSVSERVREILNSLDDLRTFVKDNSKFSHQSIDICVTELNTYVKSLEEEALELSSGNVN